MASKDETTQDAISILMADHKRVKGLFTEFKKFDALDTDQYDAMKADLIKAACDELKIHTTVEEEIFYPAVRRALPNEQGMLNEAEVEHGSVKDLIADIEGTDLTDSMTCSRFIVVSEFVEHHVGEEENDMFPKVRKAGLDLVALGKEMAARKDELKKSMDSGKDFDGTQAPHRHAMKSAASAPL